MTSSKKSELDLEKSITNKKAEESKWQCIYPNERRERNHVYTLLDISENVFEQDERSLEYVIRTGWEEAVQGWGKAAPFACLQLQKQAKKSRANETINNCLFCLDMRQNNDKSASQETKSTRDQSKSDCKLSTYGTKRESCNGTLCSTQGEKKSLPVKEYSIWQPEKMKNPEALKSKAVKIPEPTMPAPDSSESSNLKSLLVLPPVKNATPKDSADLSFKKSIAAISQANQKTFNTTSDETASGSKGTKTVEQKAGKETDCIIYDTVKEKQIHEPSSFVSRLPKAFLQGGPEQLHWPCALWPDRRITTTSHFVSLRKNSHLANMQFLHTKGIQYTKHDEIKGPFTNSIKNRSLSEAKQGNESKTQAVQLLPGLFPSLTVSHVAITTMSSRLT
uniref:Chromosome 16 open reading frame 46 n=1 Tax=Chelonoidis abingdonii TaxID=106734 RepID=A0A8C0QRE6_CHEAB